MTYVADTKYFCFLLIFQEGYYITKFKSSWANINYAFVLVEEFGDSVLCAADINYIVKQIFSGYVERIGQSKNILKIGFNIACSKRPSFRYYRNGMCFSKINADATKIDDSNNLEIESRNTFSELDDRKIKINSMIINLEKRF